MRVLLVEDNLRLHTSLRQSLEEIGYAVDSAYDGEEGEAFALSAPYDLIILDIMLPKKNGFQVCRDLRDEAHPHSNFDAHRPRRHRRPGGRSGQRRGRLPISLSRSKNLRARLRALLRREGPEKSGTLQVADLLLDPANHEVERGDLPIDLTTREFSMLEYPDAERQPPSPPVR